MCLLGAWLLATMRVPGSCHVDMACSPPCLCACSGNEFFPPPFLGLFPGRLGLWEGRRALARELFPSDPPTPWAGAELGALIVPSLPPQAALGRCLPRSVCRFAGSLGLGMQPRSAALPAPTHSDGGGLQKPLDS